MCTLFLPHLTVVNGDFADSSAASVHDIIAASEQDTNQKEVFEFSELTSEASELVADDLKHQHLGSLTDLISKSLDTPAEDNVAADDDQHILISEKTIENTMSEESFNQGRQSDDQNEISLENFDIPAAKAQLEMARQKDLQNVADFAEKAAALSSVTEQYHLTAMDLERTKAELVYLTNRFESISEASALKASDAVIRENSLRELLLAYEQSTAVNDELKTNLEVLKVQLLDLHVSTSTPMEAQLEQGLEQRGKEREAAFETLAVEYDSLKKERDHLQLELDLHVLQSKEVRADHASQTKVLGELQILYQQVSYELTQSRASVEALTIANKTVFIAVSPSIDSEAELLSCLDSLKDSTENFEILQSKMVILSNSEILEKLAAQNCELRISLLTRETNAKIKKVERESRNHINRPQNSTSTETSEIFSDVMGSISTAFITLRASFSKYTALFLTFLEPFPQHIKSGVNHTMSSVVQIVSSLPNLDHIQASFFILLLSAQANIHDLYVKTGPFYSSMFIKVISAYEYSLSQINIIASSAVSYYKEILFPAFHNVLLPQMKKNQQIVVTAVKAGHSRIIEYYAKNIYPPIEAALSPFYAQYCKSHITTLLEMKSKFYATYLEEYVLTYICPVCTSIWEKTEMFQHSAWAALTKMDGDNILESCLTLPSESLSLFLVKRANLLVYVGSLRPVQRTFGMYTEKIVTIFINFVCAYIMYILIRFVLGTFHSGLSIRNHKNKKIEIMRPNVPPSMKGLSGKDDFVVRPSNATFVYKQDERSPEGKRPLVFRRGRSPEKVGGHSPHSPYAGLPLA